MRTAFALFALLLLPLMASAAGTPKNFSELVGSLLQLLNYGGVVLVTLAITIYFGGIAMNISKAGEENAAKLRSYLSWGILILFFMISIWGVIQILETTFFSGTQGSDSVKQSLGI